MNSAAELVIHTDGAARGNPGPAAYAYTIANSSGETIEEAGCLGTMTNNQAEYIALVRALEHAARLGTNHKLRIHSDSELLVKQMNGEYRVKDAKLQGYYKQASDLVSKFADVDIRHVRRSENGQADRLANEALDGVNRSPGRSKTDASPKPRPAPAAAPRAHADAPAAPFTRDPKVRGRVLDCLKHAAQTWARGNAADPPPESVLDDIWNILVEGTDK